MKLGCFHIEEIQRSVRKIGGKRKCPGEECYPSNNICQHSNIYYTPMLFNGWVPRSCVQSATFTITVCIELTPLKSKSYHFCFKLNDGQIWYEFTCWFGKSQELFEQFRIKIYSAKLPMVPVRVAACSLMVASGGEEEQGHLTLWQRACTLCIPSLPVNTLWQLMP